MALTYLVVVNGVEKGIEKVSKILMPILVVLSVAIAIYSATPFRQWRNQVSVYPEFLHSFHL